MTQPIPETTPDSDRTRVIERPDGFYWQAKDNGREYGPFAGAEQIHGVTHDGRNELSASIMSGKDKAAGAVAGLMRVRNPISAARAVMERSRDGAELSHRSAARFRHRCRADGARRGPGDRAAAGDRRVAGRGEGDECRRPAGRAPDAAAQRDPSAAVALLRG